MHRFIIINTDAPACCAGREGCFRPGCFDHIFVDVQPAAVSRQEDGMGPQLDGTSIATVGGPATYVHKSFEADERTS